MRPVTRRLVAAGLSTSLATPTLARTPARVVSLNPCLDAIVVHVADRSQIAAISHYSRDPSGSSIAAIARTLPIIFETAEEVVALRPDLVLMGRHSAPATRAALRRIGLTPHLFAVPNTVEESLAQITHIAELVGRRTRGADLVARIRAAIAAASPLPGQRHPTALVYQANGFASAQGTLMDEMMRRTGLENAAARYGLKRTGNVPLERLIADPPDLLLSGERRPGAPDWADRVSAHPALRAISGHMQRIVFPQRLMFCGGPVLIEAAAALASARDLALERRR